MFESLLVGFGQVEAALTLNRVVLGIFFAISGYHKLFNKQRHATLVKTLKDCKIPLLWFNQWFVPTIEFIGGVALILGTFAVGAAIMCGVICFVATCTSGVKRIQAYRPIDKADVVDDVLYLPEMLYLFMLIVVVLGGPGALSVDHVVLFNTFH